jgi:hypothetical protein
MPQRVSGIPQYRERAALQSIQHRRWVPQADLHPAGDGTIASMLRKGWIERQYGPAEGYNTALRRRERLRLPPKFRPVPHPAKGPSSAVLSCVGCRFAAAR